MSIIDFPVKAELWAKCILSKYIRYMCSYLNLVVPCVFLPYLCGKPVNNNSCTLPLCRSFLWQRPVSAAFSSCAAVTGLVSTFPIVFGGQTVVWRGRGEVMEVYWVLALLPWIPVFTEKSWRQLSQRLPMLSINLLWGRSGGVAFQHYVHQ